MQLLDNDVLRTFVAIAESGSFTRAAKQVHRTPSAISMQIKRLEDTVGKALFIRDARHVQLTSEGEVLLSYGRRLLKLNEEAMEQFLSPTLEGRVGFGTSDDVGTRILPSLLAQFSRTYPAVQIDVMVDSSRTNLKRVDSGELDMALIVNGNEGQNARGEVVHSEPLVWVGREGGIAAHQSPLPIALAPTGCVWRRMATKALDQENISYRIAYTCEHSTGQEAAMIADLAIAAFPLGLVRSPLRKITDSSLPDLGDYQISLVRGQSNPITDALASYVREAFADFNGY
ncbi:LysR substrate-binding domain-containing protein [Marinobacter sp. CHS3-4]|uniref:LysR substrate-binding domain-containing protein n=1 Tax=Marinobacter sp. CHS3-4 TaxID=3045174 RepID=UPI0024B54EAB|nr:LysR substrate-binding domain-containing protein [Marinobacter sp. CHS3-4]MDI9245392.1 LysR substrate-binding domain-containing protein [Marinobacter sp. CHS3-4]